MAHTEHKEGSKAEKPRDRKADESIQGPVCRCKEVSKKKLPDLIKMAVDDLAFWKKKK